MQELVLGNKNYSTDMKEMNGNAQIIEGILQDEGAVGYVGVGYLFDENGKIRKGLKVLKISKEPDGTRPFCRRTRRPSTPATIRSPGLSIMATNGKPKGDVAEFLTLDRRARGPDDRRAGGLLHRSAGKHKAARTTRTSSAGLTAPAVERDSGIHES